MMFRLIWTVSFIRFLYTWFGNIFDGQHLFGRREYEWIDDDIGSFGHLKRIVCFFLCLFLIDIVDVFCCYFANKHYTFYHFCFCNCWLLPSPLLLLPLLLLLLMMMTMTMMMRQTSLSVPTGIQLIHTYSHVKCVE